MKITAFAWLNHKSSDLGQKYQKSLTQKHFILPHFIIPISMECTLLYCLLHIFIRSSRVGCCVFWQTGTNTLEPPSSEYTYLHVTFYPEYAGSLPLWNTGTYPTKYLYQNPRTPLSEYSQFWEPPVSNNADTYTC